MLIPSYEIILEINKVKREISRKVLGLSKYLENKNTLKWLLPEVESVVNVAIVQSWLGKLINLVVFTRGKLKDLGLVNRMMRCKKWESYHNEKVIEL